MQFLSLHLKNVTEELEIVQRKTVQISLSEREKMTMGDLTEIYTIILGVKKGTPSPSPIILMF